MDMFNIWYDGGNLIQNIYDYTEDSHNIYQTSYIPQFRKNLIGLNSYIRLKNHTHVWQINAPTRKPEVPNAYFVLA